MKKRKSGGKGEKKKETKNREHTLAMKNNILKSKYINSCVNYKWTKGSSQKAKFFRKVFLFVCLFV